jgi:hypothetical protein
MSDKELIKVRDYRKETDEDFLYSTFLFGVYYGNSWFHKIPKHIFMSNYRVFLNKLLDSPNTQVKMACLKEDENILVGYSIESEQQNSLHWIYVKKEWRKLGISKKLLITKPKFVTHLSSQGESLLEKLEGAVFNPFII